MVQIQMNNGVEGSGRVERTATGFSTVLERNNDPDINISINRGVDVEDTPYIEIDIESMDETAQRRAMANVEKTLSENGMDGDLSLRSASKLRIYSTDMQKIFDALKKGDL